MTLIFNLVKICSVPVENCSSKTPVLNTSWPNPPLESDPQDLCNRKLADNGFNRPHERGIILGLDVLDRLVNEKVTLNEIYSCKKQ